jgi:hypothetical protein
MKRRPIYLDGAGREYTDENVKLSETQEVMTTKKLAKRFVFSATYITMYIALNLLFVLAIIAVVATIMDIHPQWERASRLVELEVTQATGVISSSTCKYYAGVLSVEDKAKWEASALAETNKKCVDAEIIMRQWRFFMKVRLVLYHYVAWESGQFLPFLRDSLLYIMGAMLPLLPFLSKIVKWLSPIATATNTFNDP